MAIFIFSGWSSKKDKPEYMFVHDLAKGDLSSEHL